MRDNKADRRSDDLPQIEAAREEDSEQTDVGLIHGVQRYFECLRRRDKPGPELEAEWDRFKEIYTPMIRKDVLRRHVPAHEADDCVQEVLVAVLEKLTRFEIDSTHHGFRNWLHTLVMHKAADVARQRRRQPHTSLPPNDDTAMLADAAADPMHALGRKDARDFVQRMLDELKKQVCDADYHVFYLRKIKEWSAEQVAQALGLTRDHVRDANHRATVKFNALVMIHATHDFGL